jgi:hypothetical protein
MGYLPTIGKGGGLSDDTCTAVRRVVFQKCMAIIIDPLKQASCDRVEVRCVDLSEPPGSCPDSVTCNELSQTALERLPLLGHFLLIVRFLSGLFGVLCLELVDCAFRVAYISTSMPGLCCSYGCFSGLHYVMLLWFQNELCDCLYMPL